MNPMQATRGNSRGFLKMDEVKILAPSVFTTHASPKVSDKYQFANTADVLGELAKAGYVPVKAGQTKARTPDGGAYTRHVVRVMHEKYLDPSNRRVGDVVPQAIIQNAHDRTSALHLSAGLFRLVCSNGLAVEATNFTSVRVLHSDPRLNDLVIDGLNLIREVTDNVVMPQVEKMIATELTAAQVADFANAATVLKHGRVHEAEAAMWLTIRREEDAARNMWAVLNRIQENAVKGGYETRDAAGRTITAKGITSATRDLDFNTRLWHLGGKVLESLTA